MKSTFNLSAYAVAALASSGSLAQHLSGASMKAYIGRQPLTADTALGSDNILAATWPFPPYSFSIINQSGIIVLEPLADTIWLVAGLVTFVRVTKVGNTYFDASLDSLEPPYPDSEIERLQNNPDLVIRRNPVRAGDLAHVVSGRQPNLYPPPQGAAVVMKA
jgi:hypothetical protein